MFATVVFAIVVVHAIPIGTPELPTQSFIHTQSKRTYCNNKICMIEISK